MAEQGISVAGEHLQNGLEAVKKVLEKGWRVANGGYQGRDGPPKVDSGRFERISIRA